MQSQEAIRLALPPHKYSANAERGSAPWPWRPDMLIPELSCGFAGIPEELKITAKSLLTSPMRVPIHCLPAQNVGDAVEALGGRYPDVLQSE